MTEPKLPRARAIPVHLRLADPAGTPEPRAPRKSPTISEDLVEYLEGKFPEVDPRPELTEANLWFLLGRRDLVRFLRLMFEQSKKES